jgi:hypothetical protein
MKRSTKLVAATLTILVCVPILGIVLLFVTLKLHASGTWPFPPPQRIENSIAIPNGGTVHITAVEQPADPMLVKAQYRPPGGRDVEPIGEWLGRNTSPSIYMANGLVILMNSDQKLFYVRTSQGRWKWFSIDFPDEHSSLPISHYTTLTTLTEEELLRIRKDIDSDDRKDWSPAIRLDGFDPDTREISVRYEMKYTVRHIFLKLSPDGVDLSLAGIRKDKDSRMPESQHGNQL